MSNKTEFKDVLVTKINYSKDGNYVTFAIEDNRTFNNKSRIHKFNITAQSAALVDIKVGDRVIIEASLVSKEYEHNNQPKTSWDIWASKVYCIVRQSEATKQPEQQSAPPQQATLSDDDIPF